MEIQAGMSGVGRYHGGQSQAVKFVKQKADLKDENKMVKDAANSELDKIQL